MAVYEGLGCSMIDRNVLSDLDLPAVLVADLHGNFEFLVVCFQDRLYSFALRLTGSVQDAEEVAQDTFVRAFRALEGYTAERTGALALRPWLYQIALNVVRNRSRRKRLQMVPLDASEDGTAIEPLADPSDLPEAVWERNERSQDLAALLRALPERYRTAVILRHVEGLGYGDAAIVLNQPVGTVKSNVHRGVSLLRDALSTSIEEKQYFDG